jgi:hypothetical protein
VVITPAAGDDAPLWIAELVRAGGQGLFSSVLIVAAPAQAESAEAALTLLARLDISRQLLRTDTRLRAGINLSPHAQSHPHHADRRRLHRRG